MFAINVTSDECVVTCLETAETFVKEQGTWIEIASKYLFMLNLKQIPSVKNFKVFLVVKFVSLKL